MEADTTCEVCFIFNKTGVSVAATTPITFQIVTWTCLTRVMLHKPLLMNLIMVCVLHTSQSGHQNIKDGQQG